ncbi:MAG: MFS transporter [Clostridiales bacterium]|jgi:Na+/melibiose symporter-like transporter|nr:MFS transporter [Clostridiales bacterium]
MARNTQNKAFVKQALLLSLPFAWMSIFNTVFDSLMPIIATAPVAEGGLGYNDLVKGVIMAIDNILALFLFPLFGALSDKSRNRFGKRTPFILFFSSATIIVWIFAGLTLGLSVRWLFIVLLSVTLSFNSMSRPAGLALLPDITPMSKRRSANAVAQIAAIVATVIGVALCELKILGFQYIFYIDSALIAVLIAVFAAKVRENKLRRDFDALPEDEKKPAPEDRAFRFRRRPCERKTQ